MSQMMMFEKEIQTNFNLALLKAQSVTTKKFCYDTTSKSKQATLLHGYVILI